MGGVMGKTNRARYTLEFKLEAVRGFKYEVQHGLKIRGFKYEVQHGLKIHETPDVGF